MHIFPENGSGEYCRGIGARIGNRAGIGSDGPFIWLGSPPIAKAIRRDRRNSVLARRTTGFQFCRNFVHGRRTTGNRARYRRSGKIGNFLGNVRNGPRDRALSACSVRSRSSSLSGPAFPQETRGPFLCGFRLRRRRKDHLDLHADHLAFARQRSARNDRERRDASCLPAAWPWPCRHRCGA